MSDKKQIEEMARTIGGCHTTPNCKTCDEKSGVGYCYNKLGAKRLYNAGYRKIPEGAVVLRLDRYQYKDKKIYCNAKHIGYIDFSIYEDEKALGIGNFEIIEKRKGYGSRVIDDIIEKYKNKFDLIYCFVDKENVGAIEFYKKVGKVCFDKVNDKNQYYVILYENEIEQARKETAREILKGIYQEIFDYFKVESIGDLGKLGLLDSTMTYDVVTDKLDEFAAKYGVEVDDEE